MERLAVDATKNVYAIISRLEALRKKIVTAAADGLPGISHFNPHF